MTEILSYRDRCLELEAEIAKGTKLLDDYYKKAETAKKGRNIAIFIAVLLAIAAGLMFRQWQDAELRFALSEAASEYYRQDAIHYPQKYFELLGD